MSTKKLALILFAVLGVLIIGVYFLARYFFGGFGTTTIEYWGLWEPESVYTTVIADYQKLHPNVTINYKKKSQLQYRDTLSSALKSSAPPDIFRFHNTWLPMLKNYLSPVPNSAYTAAAFKATFYPVAQKDLYSAGSYYGIPLEIDTLALYVNENIFTQAGLTYPTSFPQEFLDTARKLTVRNGDRIERAGAAMGNAGNVTHWEDILSLLLLQSEVDLINPTGSLAEEAFSYYIGFQTLDQVWDETQDEAKLAFAKGNLAMYFGYSWDYFDIKAINPALSLKFISSKEELSKLYTAEAKYRGFGEPYGRVDMASMLATDPTVSVFVNQAQTAQSSYLSSLTWDGSGGINTRIKNYFADTINSSKNQGNQKQALETLIYGINQVLSGYGLVAPLPAPK